MPRVGASGIGQAGTGLADRDSRDALHGQVASHAGCAGVWKPAYTCRGAKTISTCAYPAPNTPSVSTQRGRLHAGLLTPCLDHFCPSPVVTPLGKVVRDGACGQHILGQHIPLAATPVERAQRMEG